MKETERRKRFFQIALKLINEKGFKAMTMRDLAEALECDVSNIYNYVPSKMALLDQLLFEISHKFHEGMADIEGSAYPPIEKIKAIIAMHVRLTVENPYQVALLTSEWRNLKKTKKKKKKNETDRVKEFLEFRASYEKKLESIIQAGIKSGDIPDSNSTFLTKSVLSSVRWLYNWYTPDNQQVNPVELERLMTNFVLKGLSK